MNNQNSERKKEGEGLLNTRCSDCQNLDSGNWCTAKRRTVPGTRHLRRCDLFQLGEPDPIPARLGKPQHPNLVQCVSCDYFAGWGLCDAGVGELSGELYPRIWQSCGSHIPAEPTGPCSDCSYLERKVCTVSGFPVTQPNSPTSCQKFMDK